MSKKTVIIKGGLSFEYGMFSAVIMLRMSQRYLYFGETPLVGIKNKLAAAIRELRVSREDWRDAKTSSKKQVRIHDSHNGTLACIEPSKQRFSVDSGQNTSYFVTLRSTDANTFLKDIKDVLLKMRLSKRRKNADKK